MKIPYQIRIEPEQLEELKELAKINGTSVNHEIRQGIRIKYENVFCSLINQSSGMWWIKFV